MTRTVHRRALRGAGLSVPDDLRAAWSARLAEVARAVGRPSLTSARSIDGRDLVAALESAIDITDRSHVWLALATLSGTLPDQATVVEVARSCELDGATAIWAEVARSSAPSRTPVTVRVVVGATLADVNHTVSTDLATGIQRVTRATVSRWLRTRDCLPVAWTTDLSALRELTPSERARLDGGTVPDDPNPRAPTVIVPWRSTVVVPELAPESDRNRRLLSLARWSGNATGVIGFDCVPLTSAETTPEGFPAVFFDHLATVREFDRIATISGAATTEYEGWRTMLGAVGQPGPEIRSIPLADEAPATTLSELTEARARLMIGDLPLVVVVGSHEPRKNHLAVLHAAELCWRSGSRFSVTFIGGTSWASADFDQRLAELQRAGRPVESILRLPDPLLWAAYRLARFTVFPSLSEGFGLPVAESLAVGTPVITSRYGSMREIGEAGGTLMVDPRVDHDIATAMQRLLDDDALHDTLAGQARLRTPRSWDAYATETWDFLTAKRR